MKCQPFLSSAESDFIDLVTTVTLPRPGGGTNRVVEVIIPIVDDTIIERQETFVGYIEIADAVDPSTISLGITAVQLIINDNDGKISSEYSTCFILMAAMRCGASNTCLQGFMMRESYHLLLQYR